MALQKGDIKNKGAKDMRSRKRERGNQWRKHFLTRAG